jgi:hypothetical protein
VELFKVLREIQRHKILVVLVVCVSAAIGFLLAFKPGFPPQSRQYQQAIASSDILIDTRNSQVVDVGGHGPELSTLASRANLLGNLMTTGPLKETIAAAADVRPENLVVVPPANAETPGVTPTPVETGHGVHVPSTERSTLTFSTDDTLPILHVVAEAPDTETANALALATVVKLRQYLSSIAATQRIPAARQLVVRQFGAPTITTVTRGVAHSLAIIVTVALVLLGCGAIVGGSWFSRRWKEFTVEEANADRKSGGDGPDETGDGPDRTGDDSEQMAPAEGGSPTSTSAPSPGYWPGVDPAVTMQRDVRRSG